MFHRIHELRTALITLIVNYHSVTFKLSKDESEKKLIDMLDQNPITLVPLLEQSIKDATEDIPTRLSLLNYTLDLIQQLDWFLSITPITNIEEKQIQFMEKKILSFMTDINTLLLTYVNISIPQSGTTNVTLFGLVGWPTNLMSNSGTLIQKTVFPVLFRCKPNSPTPDQIKLAVSDIFRVVTMKIEIARLIETVNYEKALNISSLEERDKLTKALSIAHSARTSAKDRVVHKQQTTQIPEPLEESPQTELHTSQEALTPRPKSPGFFEQIRRTGAHFFGMHTPERGEPSTQFQQT